ncbi:hypothetical protein SLT36_31775 (plasmid) [Aminobacter sp. BA135]|uniref:hypothetical protein n=1 Tax=Aminobacter sp. BA135 TaxID=537596 RepID=UPI003D7AA0FE
MGLNSDQVSWLSYYVNAGDRVGYYTLLASMGERYGTQALGVVSADTVAGAVANIYLRETVGYSNVTNEQSQTVGSDDACN